MQINAVIIVAGGTGTRMKSDLPKQFLLLKGLPVLMHSVSAFFRFDPEILITIALPEDYHDYWKELCRNHGFTVPHTLVAGGETRFRSVQNSLVTIPDEAILGIHDGVRPLVSQETIAAAYRTAALHGNAVPVIPVSESVRKTENGKNEPVSRDLLRLIQTPQVFRAKEIKMAYAAASRTDFTDDATVLEATGSTLHLTEGNAENIKITRPSDLLFAEAVLSAASQG